VHTRNTAKRNDTIHTAPFELVRSLWRPVHQAGEDSRKEQGELRLACVEGLTPAV
jgi:hypothetical protein